MDAKQLIILALQVAILGTVFGFGLNATRDDLLYLVRRPGLLLRSLLSILVVVPFLTVVLVKLFDLRSTVEIVLVALAVSPVPPLLPQRETKAGGRRSYGLGLMVVVGIVAIAAVPLVVGLLARVFERSLATGQATIARIVLLTVVLPLVAGMAVRALLPRIAERLNKPVRLVANGLLLVAALALAAGSWQAIWAAIGDGTVLAIVAFLVAALLVGHLAGRTGTGTFNGARTFERVPASAIALAIASANYPHEHFGGTILLYLLLNLIIALPYMIWQRRKMAKRQPPAAMREKVHNGDWSDCAVRRILTSAHSPPRRRTMRFAPVQHGSGTHWLQRTDGGWWPQDVSFSTI